MVAFALGVVSVWMKLRATIFVPVVPLYCKPVIQTAAAALVLLSELTVFVKTLCPNADVASIQRPITEAVEPVLILAAPIVIFLMVLPVKLAMPDWE